MAGFPGGEIASLHDVRAGRAKVRGRKLPTGNCGSVVKQLQYIGAMPEVQKLATASCRCGLIKTTDHLRLLSIRSQQRHQHYVYDSSKTTSIEWWDIECAEFL